MKRMMQGYNNRTELCELAYFGLKLILIKACNRVSKKTSDSVSMDMKCS